MTALLVGFDSAWTATNCGALVGLFRREDRTFQELGPPQAVDYRKAEQVILEWQRALNPASTLVLLDQPTIVRNQSGQRPVEHIVGSSVSLRYGGMQPANTAKTDMFGRDAPVWSFLARLGGPTDPLKPSVGAQVFETYPVLGIISLGWTLPDARPTGRLPKYNPQRKKTFSMSDWKHVRSRASDAFDECGLDEISQWLDRAAHIETPRKCNQDSLDACLCLLVALHLIEDRDCLMIGDRESGYVVVPHGVSLQAELEARCRHTRRIPSEWVRVFRFPTTEREGMV